MIVPKDSILLFVIYAGYFLVSLALVIVFWAYVISSNLERKIQFSQFIARNSVHGKIVLIILGNTSLFIFSSSFISFLTLADLSDNEKHEYLIVNYVYIFFFLSALSLFLVALFPPAPEFLGNGVDPNDTRLRSVLPKLLDDDTLEIYSSSSENSSLVRNEHKFKAPVQLTPVVDNDPKDEKIEVKESLESGDTEISIIIIDDNHKVGQNLTNKNTNNNNKNIIKRRNKEHLLRFNYGFFWNKRLKESSSNLFHYFFLGTYVFLSCVGFLGEAAFVREYEEGNSLLYFINIILSLLCVGLLTFGTFGYLLMNCRIVGSDSNACSLGFEVTFWFVLLLIPNYLYWGLQITVLFLSNDSQLFYSSDNYYYNNIIENY